MGKFSINDLDVNAEARLWHDTTKVEQLDLPRYDWFTGAPGGHHRWGDIISDFMPIRGLGGGAVKVIAGGILYMDGHIFANGGHGLNARDVYFDDTTNTDDFIDERVTGDRAYNIAPRAWLDPKYGTDLTLPIYTPFGIADPIPPNPPSSPYRYACGGGGGGGSILLGAGILRIKKNPLSPVLEAKGGNGGCPEAGGGGGGLIYAQHNNF